MSHRQITVEIWCLFATVMGKKWGEKMIRKMFSKRRTMAKQTACKLWQSSDLPSVLLVSLLYSCFLLIFSGSRKFCFKRFKSISKEWIFTRYGCTLLMVMITGPRKTHGQNVWSEELCNMVLKKTYPTIIKQIGLPLRHKEHVIRFKGDNKFLIMLWCAIEHKENRFYREWKLTSSQGYPFCKVE